MTLNSKLYFFSRKKGYVYFIKRLNPSTGFPPRNDLTMFKCYCVLISEESLQLSDKNKFSLKNSTLKLNHPPRKSKITQKLIPSLLFQFELKFQNLRGKIHNILKNDLQRNYFNSICGQ